MTPAEWIDAAQQRCDAATKGPWGTAPLCPGETETWVIDSDGDPLFAGYGLIGECSVPDADGLRHRRGAGGAAVSADDLPTALGAYATEVSYPCAIVRAVAGHLPTP